MLWWFKASRYPRTSTLPSHFLSSTGQEEKTWQKSSQVQIRTLSNYSHGKNRLSVMEINLLAINNKQEQWGLKGNYKHLPPVHPLLHLPTKKHRGMWQQSVPIALSVPYSPIALLLLHGHSASTPSRVPSAGCHPSHPARASHRLQLFQHGSNTALYHRPIISGTHCFSIESYKWQMPWNFSSDTGQLPGSAHRGQSESPLTSLHQNLAT